MYAVLSLGTSQISRGAAPFTIASPVESAAVAYSLTGPCASLDLTASSANARRAFPALRWKPVCLGVGDYRWVPVTPAGLPPQPNGRGCNSGSGDSAIPFRSRCNRLRDMKFHLCHRRALAIHGERLYLWLIEHIMADLIDRQSLDTGGVMRYQGHYFIEFTYSGSGRATSINEYPTPFKMYRLV